jgi:N-acetylmuramoyl-L-alanine amidase
MRGRDSGKQAADAMQASFRQNLLPTNRNAAAVSSLFLLKHIHSPATLVEIGFLSNPQEEKHLGTTLYQQQVAFALYSGTLQYFQKAPVGWRAHIPSFLR